jgi:hypothetical protein
MILQRGFDVFDLSFQTERERLAATISAEVEADSVAEYEEGPRWHLGGSEIGKPCEMQLWAGFRWLRQEKHDGRKHRLFKRGHYEEPKFIKRLRRIGFEVFEFDADGKQYKISGHKGHYGGSLDGIAIAPARYGLPGPLLVEFKTHNEKSFAKLAGPITSKWPVLTRNTAKAEGMRKSKPVHFSQMSSYGQAYALPYGLYCAVNKETDELYFEIIQLDFNHGVRLYEKAGRVIFSQTPPAKIAQSAAFGECKLCHYSPICHHGAAPEVNCRSCEHASPVDGGEWHCRIFDGIIQREQVPQGCPQWRRIV